MPPPLFTFLMQQMLPMKTSIPLLTSFAAVALATAVQAQSNYAATAKTVTVDTGDLNASPATNRLFLDAAFGVPAPIDTTIWFVADPSRNGIPTNAVPGSVGDDVVLFKDVVDGTLPFNRVGQYQRIGITVDRQFESADIYVVLWNGRGATFAPGEGATFGILKLGVRPPPTTGSGNASWSIVENINAAQFRVGGTVVEPNRPPAFGTIAAVEGSELTEISFTAQAVDPDAGQTVRYALGSGAPAGATIDPASGLVRWTPTEVDGPSERAIEVRATDNGSPELTASVSVTVRVLEVNQPPTLAPLDSRTLLAGVPLTLTLQGADTDLPAQGISYRLGSGPSGAEVNPVTGELRWTPTVAQAGTNMFEVEVSDSGVPPLAATRSFTVTVEVPLPPVAPVLAAVLGTDTVIVSFATESGRTYDVQTRSAVDAGVWTAFGSAIVANGSRVSVEIPAGGSEGFIRVVAR